MGGGDLNTKKSWHPNTMKNQERVWKAEQAAAEEKKRILELQREREEERDRSHLKDMAQRNFGAHSTAANDNRLHWMYDKPDKQVQEEDYLLGKAIGKSDDGNQGQNAIPALSRRVVGSSMMTSADDTQVDLARKLREDPLLLVKERERAARAALLNNPLQRKKLTELLRKDKEEKEQKMSKSKKKSKKKVKDLDDALAAKLNALAGNKGIDLTSLLNSGDSSESSSDDNKSEKKKKKRKQKKKKSKKSQQSSGPDSDSDSSDDDVSIRKSKKKSSKSKSDKDKVSSESHKDNKLVSRKRHSDDDASNDKSMRKKSKKDSKRHGSESERENFRQKQESTEESGRYWADTDRRSKNDREEKQASVSDKRDRSYREPSPRRLKKAVSPRRDTYRREYPKDVSPRSSPPRRDAYKRDNSPKRMYEDRKNRKQGLSEEEKAARLAEMALAGAEREVERGERVARQRVEDREAESRAPRHSRHEARALPDSLESRIRSNRHYIQRDRLHMNEHFARR